MARTTAQIDADLAAVRAARLAILQGGAIKSYSQGNRAWTHLDLSDLNATEQALLAERRGASDATEGAIILGVLNQVSG